MQFVVKCQICCASACHFCFRDCKIYKKLSKVTNHQQIMVLLLIDYCLLTLCRMQSNTQLSVVNYNRLRTAEDDEDENDEEEEAEQVVGLLNECAAGKAHEATGA